MGVIDEGMAFEMDVGDQPVYDWQEKRMHESAIPKHPPTIVETQKGEASECPS